MDSRVALSFFGAAVVLAACNGLRQAQDDVQPSTGAPATAASHRTWTSPNIETGRPRLLFVSDDIGTLNVFSMPDMTLRGKVQGLSTPLGECADGTGQIWVAEESASKLTRWSRDLQNTGELADNYGQPFACAFDRTTGNLAVTNNDYAGHSLVIYAHAIGSGVKISNPQQRYYQWLDYDRNGNLWVDGWDYNNRFILSSCNASSCSTIQVTGGTIHYPGFVQWAAGESRWYIADPECGSLEYICIYPVSASGKLGKPIWPEDSNGQKIAGGSFEQGAITNAESRVLVAGFRELPTGSSVARWSFPAGGAPNRENNPSGLTQPIGAAISK